MPDTVLMLEDSPDRLTRFTSVLSTLAPHLHFHHWRNAHRMIRECPPYLPSCRLICLDHDLDPEGDEDPGDGLVVAKFLAPLRPACPILIHSSNADGARRMIGEFELEEITASTILPLGSDWVERYWRNRLLALLTN
ncbi:MAG TPA: cyclic-phosphate processing receiver domain-containing protein [Phycisphaerae bacterium]|nr:cyclic-phosphate processing receiver domain-containing protein [Phycisphaerae bacterium]